MKLCWVVNIAEFLLYFVYSFICFVLILLLDVLLVVLNTLTILMINLILPVLCLVLFSFPFLNPFPPFPFIWWVVIAGTVTYAGTGDPIYPRQTERINDERTGTPPSISKEDEGCKSL